MLDPASKGWRFIEHSDWALPVWHCTRAYLSQKMVRTWASPPEMLQWILNG